MIMLNVFKKLGITDKESFIKFAVQFIKFGIVGFSNTAISLGIYYIFVLINKDLYLIGNTVGFIVSVLNAYYWNSKYVFKKTESGNLKQIIKTFTAYGSTFLLSSAMLFVLVDLMSLSEKIAPLITLAVTIPLNFLLNKFWTFKEK